MAEERLGASFSIDVTQLKAGLNTANRLIRESQTQFQKAAAGLQDWTKNENALNAKITSLNRIIPVQEEKVRALKEQYEKLSKDGMKETEDRAIQLRTQINREEAALESNRAELKRQEEALEEVKKASDDAGDSIEETGDKANDTSGKFTVMKGALASLVADGFRMAIDAAKQFATELVNVGITFDDSMAKVAAVSGATGTELEQLRAKAKELGESTKFTASESAEAFNYMAMAGWKTEDMLNGIEGILNLAAASGADLATTSDIVTDALTAMGYEAKDAGRLADVMAAASSNANTNVEMMGLTFQYAAPLVGALGYSMEDTAKAIGLMANSGVKGEKAGTALRSIFTRLANPPKDCAESLKELGVSLTDSSGKMKSFDTVMQDLRKAFVNLDEVEKATHASNIAGQEALSGMLAIVNAAPEDYAKLTAAINDSEGAAQNMADTMLDTLGGDMTVLNSQLEGVRLTIYEQLSPTLRDLVSDAQKWLSSVDWKSFGKKASDALKSIIDYGKKLGKSILPVLKTALNLVGKALKFVIDNFKVLAPTVLLAVGAFKAFKAVLAVTTAIQAAKTAVAGLTAGVGLATKAQYAWNAAMSANPIGAVITAVALLASGVAFLATALSDAEEETDFLSESQREAVEAAKESAEAYRDNKTAAEEMAAANAANVDYVANNLLPQLENLVGANGDVLEGEEARANFILGELNKALGTEYNDLSEIVDANGKIKQSIYDVINAKKAQIYLESYEETYKEAIQKTAEAEKRRATEAQGVAIAKEEVVKAETALAEAIEKTDEAARSSNEYALNQAIFEEEQARNALNQKKEALAKQEKAYKDAATAAQEFYNDIDTYESASKAMTEGNTQAVIDLLGNFGNGFKTAASTMREGAEEQKKILGQQVIDTEVNLQIMEDDYAKYSEGMTDEEKKQAQARIENARKQASDAKAEFYKVGGAITTGMAEGVQGQDWVLNKAMQVTIAKAVKAAKEAAEIKSPSRLFRNKIGKMLGLGVALGVEDTTKNVVNTVKGQVKAIRAAYDLDGFAPAVSAGLNVSGGGNVNNSKTVTVNQYNTYSQAHSRYELYKSKQQTAAAVRLALAGGV